MPPVARRVAGILVLSLAITLAPAADRDAEGIAFFEKQVRPLLVEHCYRCHSADAKSLKGGLRLDTRAGVRAGGESGPALVPGDPERSRLIQAVRRANPDQAMPPKTTLDAGQVAVLVEWVRRGAPDPREGTAMPAKPPPKPAWALAPLLPVVAPVPRDHAWSRTPIDRFIAAGLDAAGLAPSPAADPLTLLRRTSIDLTGLPPTPDEIAACAADHGSDAYERMVDRLLASPRHGERWARHWLDLARFAESHGFEQDYDRPTAWPYRDFVVDAFNRDLPYDTFVQWQVAGDELAPQDIQARRATGFLAAGIHATQITKNQAEKERYDELDDLVNTVGTTMLGLTTGCARCHDHKFDPISSHDYYALAATFTTTVRSEQIVGPGGEQDVAALAAFKRDHAALEAPLRALERSRLATVPADWLAKPPPSPPKDAAAALAKPPAQRDVADDGVLLAWYRSLDAEWKQFDKAVRDHASKQPKPGTTLICSEGVPAVRLHTQGPDFYPETWELRRGSLDHKVAVAQPGFLSVLSTPTAESRWRLPPPSGATTSHRRAALARWLTDVEHGAGRLLARVVVNRLWQHHFGRGIVATPSDFGAQGDLPTHPALLDWLANELIAQGWRLKPIHRLILLSSVWRQGSGDAAQRTKDPTNRWWGRRDARRLEAEAIRDGMAFAAGTLDLRMGGPGTLADDQPRRALYFTIKRSRLIPFLTQFDFPNPIQGVAVRPPTTTAPQSLFLMNHPTVRRFAAALAARIRPAGSTPDAALTAAWLRTHGRPPTAGEQAAAQRFLAAYAAGDAAAWTDLCHGLLCANGAIYVD